MHEGRGREGWANAATEEGRRTRDHIATRRGRRVWGEVGGVHRSTSRNALHDVGREAKPVRGVRMRALQRVRACFVDLGRALQKCERA